VVHRKLTAAQRMRLLKSKLKAAPKPPSEVHVTLDGISFTASTGVPLRLRRHWKNVKHGFRHASVKREGAYCVVSGYVSGGGTTVARLPKWCRPRQREIFGVYHSQHAQGRLDVRKDGVIELTRYGAGRHLSTGRVSLDSIRFAAHMNTRRLRAYPVFKIRASQVKLSRLQAFRKMQRVRLNAYFGFYYRWWQASRETWWRAYRHQLRLHRLRRRLMHRARKPSKRLHRSVKKA